MNQGLYWPAALALAAGCLTLRAAEPGPMIGPCPVFPADNIWNTRVDALPRHPLSERFVESVGAGRILHPDFGAGLYEGAPIGIPLTVIPRGQKRVRVQFEYSGESDLSAYPIPPDAAVERNGNPGSDRHIIVIDKDDCVLWELFATQKQKDGTWKAGSGAIYDLKCNCMRPDGWTAADAAGLPILPGLVRYDEVEAGEIRHALRFTAEKTRKDWVWPARHAASQLADRQYPPMGQRFRLKADVDLSGFSKEAQVVLQALKKYGMMLADNGGNWFLSGTPDDRWPQQMIDDLRRIKGSDFEAVDAGDLMVAHHSARAEQRQ